MESTNPKHQGTCQDTEWPPNLTINRLPDEVLLEVFDSYRQSTEPYDNQWRYKYAWFNLAHLCRRWRAVMFASSSRLDLNIVVGPEKPGHIKTILSSHLPILIDYSDSYRPRDISGSAIWRMRAALGHRDRVREISFGGGDFIFGKFIKATSYHFPALESLLLYFPDGPEPEIPPTFLRGPDRSDLCLRRLRLYGSPVAPVSGLLFSATALTNLTLSTTNAADFDPSEGSLLLACLRSMQCLRSLDLATYFDFRDFASQDPTPKDIVPLLKLTRFHYSGPTTFLNSFMSGLSAPSLQDARFMLSPGIEWPLLYLSRVIDDVREEFRSVSVTFDMDYFHLVSSAHSGEIDHFDHFKKPSFRFSVDCSPYSINSINSTPSTKLAMAEELALNFPRSNMNMTNLEQVFSLRAFLRQFRSVRVLRVNPFVREVGLYLQQDDGEAILPVLEEVELSIPRSARYPDEEYQRCAAEALAAFEPCERADRLVKVYRCEQTETQSRNARSR